MWSLRTVWVFLALFVTSVGLGMVFVRSDDLRILVGSVIFSVGLTTILNMTRTAKQ
jgi:hypothetical protein